MTDNKSLSAELRRWRHKVRGTEYDEIGTAELQASTGVVEEGALLTVYRGDDGKLWARRAREFGDGRFERVAARVSPPGNAGLREGAARAIDPAAWKSHDHALENAANGPGKYDWPDYARRMVAPSLAKADAILSLLSTDRREEDWQPIETAPRDGTRIWVGRDNDDFGWIAGTAHWVSGMFDGWLSRGDGRDVADGLGLAHPTHWRTLPSAPAIRKLSPAGEKGNG